MVLLVGFAYYSGCLSGAKLNLLEAHALIQQHKADLTIKLPKSKINAIFQVKDK
jgi:hypothetical protein